MNGRILEYNGCHLHSDCFTCPFPQCIYENSTNDGRHHKGQLPRTMERLEKVRQLRDSGYTSDAMVNIIGTSRRSIYRLLQQLEKEGR